MEADECGLTREMRFVARRLEVVAVTGLLWISRCVLGGAGFFRIYFERTRLAAIMRPPCLIYLSTNNEATPRERSDRRRCLLISKKASSYRGAYRVPLFNYSVRLCVSVYV